MKWLWFVTALLVAARAAGATSYVDCNSNAAQFKVDRCVYLIDASRSSLSEPEYYRPAGADDEIVHRPLKEHWRQLRHRVRRGRRTA